MKLHHLMDEMEKVIDDKSERDQVLGSDLGSILCCTQVDSPTTPSSFLILNKIRIRVQNHYLYSWSIFIVYMRIDYHHFCP